MPPGETIEGRYFPPGTSRAEAARLGGAAGALWLETAGSPPRPVGAVVAVTDALGHLPRKISFADGGTFETAPGADLSHLLGRRREGSALLRRVERSWKAIVAAGIGLVLLLAGLQQFGLPAAADLLAGATPDAALAAMDDGALATLDGAAFRPTMVSAARRHEISRAFGRLVAEAEPDLRGVSLLFRDGGGIGANAFALPGGTIVITDQMIAEARSEDEILGVLAHELGHVEGRHGLRQIYGTLGFALVAGLVTGDFDGLAHDVAAQAAAVQALSYSRDFERAADRRGVELMLRVGRDPMALADIVARLSRGQGTDGVPAFLENHPGGEERRRDMLAHARRLGWQGP